MLSLQRCFLLLLASAACGRSDTYVNGGFFPTDAYPPVVLDTVRSSISGEVTLSDASGQPSGKKLAVVMISTAPDLCKKIKANPGYFRTPPEPFIALALYAPLDKSGTFYVGRAGDDGTNGEAFTSPGPTDGGAAAPLLTVFALPGSLVSLSDFGLREPGNADGTLDLLFASQSAIPQQMYGHFKSNTCDGFDHVLLP